MEINHGKTPYNHWCINDFLPKQLANMLFNELNEFTKNTDEWWRYDNHFEDKYAENRWERFPPTIKTFLYSTLAGPFVNFLELTTGVKGLIADHSLRGSGIHLHKKFGKLHIHKDFTRHEELGLIRRLNVLIYFNKNYESKHGGQLELWSKDMKKCEVSIEPVFNKAVIFETPEAPHGLGSPWMADFPRKSISLYYYTSPTAEDLKKEHLSTQFLKKPDEMTTVEIEILRDTRNRGRIT